MVYTEPSSIDVWLTGNGNMKLLINNNDSLWKTTHWNVFSALVSKWNILKTILCKIWPECLNYNTCTHRVTNWQLAWWPLKGHWNRSKMATLSPVPFITKFTETLCGVQHYFIWPFWPTLGAFNANVHVYTDKYFE